MVLGYARSISFMYILRKKEVQTINHETTGPPHHHHPKQQMRHKSRNPPSHLHGSLSTGQKHPIASVSFFSLNLEDPESCRVRCCFCGGGKARPDPLVRKGRDGLLRGRGFVVGTWLRSTSRYMVIGSAEFTWTHVNWFDVCAWCMVRSVLMVYCMVCFVRE